MVDTCVVEDCSICMAERRRDQIGVSWQGCDAFLHLDDSVNWTTIGSYDIQSKKESVVYSLPSLLFKEQRETGRDHIGSSVVSVKQKQCGKQFKDDGTKDQGVRETREHRHYAFSTSSTR